MVRFSIPAMADDVFGILGTIQAGAFRVDAVVAEGGFAVVYRAYHGAFRADVALKCLKVPGSLKEDEQKEFLEKFREEAELLFRLSATSPNIVRPLHVGTLTQSKGRFVPFIAIEWLEGETLEKLIEARRDAGKPPLSLVDTVDMLGPVAGALARAHAFPVPGGTVSIIHRDLKPENIFIARVHGESIAKILDFGIAKVKSTATQIAGRQSSKASAIFAFTPAYGAPEQWLPKRYGQTGPWTDVWGMAVTVVECVSGHAPIEGDQVAMMGAAIDPGRRPTPRAEGVELGDAAEAVFARALAVDPRDRYQNMAAFWNDLREAAFGGRTAVVDGGVPRAAPSEARELPRTMAAPDARRFAAPSEASGGPGGTEGPLRAGRVRPETQKGGALDAVPDLVIEPPRASRPEPRVSAPPVSARARPPPSGVPDYVFGNTIASLDDDELDRGRQPPVIGVMDGVGIDSRRSVPARSVSRQAWQATFHAQSPPLDLKAPIQLLVVSVLLMAGDYAYATVAGDVLRFGPARMFWLAGPLAVIGAIWVGSRLLRHDE